MAHEHASAHHEDGAAHGTVKSYMTGFILSVILTAIPFGLIMSGALPASTSIPIILILGVIQIVIHLIYFLHMNTSSSQMWNVAAFVFTLIIVAITVVGSLWIMAHLDMNMMPGMMPAE
ncbi:cytochrome o ubiquinol oxidase operon protein cyoD [Pseudoxanthobacter soli DSM 19599]|uniref:Cytochrome bo(3) ubiquinol oxidase subunit 4 n=1 Tax=Pseudoxanthobacter soli DSM 19599 TaxID=1123029 RepID=A0A1M7Z987_9HYPH|nr:cytochrome o ubiquinol oxidase subunit IV [Pseudoxanthobacter soli]SHO61483.1 cytochrome o ubiquinol oxidase operon protein cyoD [Pseudoxanthobacter soli DSM 19599]